MGILRLDRRKLEQRGGNLKKHLLIILIASFFLLMSSLSFAKVEKGMSGTDVQNVQYMLINSGYMSGGADGVFGSSTESAVRQFQADHGLEADGIVGDQTLAALSGNSGSSSPVGYYRKRIVMEATAYTPYDPGNSGYTANGNWLEHGLVSVDPSVIPLGTRLYIEGYGYAVADDTGGDINGNRIDLGMSSRSEANNFGRQNVVVYIL